MPHDARLAELGITLPEAPAPAGMYKPVVQVGNLLYLAGHIPATARGKVGADMTEQEVRSFHGLIKYLAKGKHSEE